MMDLSDTVIDHIFPFEKMLTLNTLTASELLEGLRYEAYKGKLSEGVEFDALSITHPIMQAFLRFQAAKLGVADVFDSQFPSFRQHFLDMWHRFPRRADDDAVWMSLIDPSVEEATQWEEDTLALDGWFFGGLCLFTLGEDLDVPFERHADRYRPRTVFCMLQTGSSKNDGLFRFDEIRVSVVDMGGPDKSQSLKISTQAFMQTADNAEDFANLLLDWTGLICTRLCQILTIKDYCLLKGIKVGVNSLDNIRFTFRDGVSTSIALTGITWRDVPKRIDLWDQGSQSHPAWKSDARSGFFRRVGADTA